MLARLSSNLGASSTDLSAGRELAAMVERVRELTNSSGAAIALTTDIAGEIDCRASSGATAPETGRTVVMEDSLTAHCIQSGKQVRCDNAETDLRVQQAAMFDMGVRSLVLTPIRQAGRVRGVFSVLANVPYAFSAADLAQLSATADEIAEILGRDEKPAKPALVRPEKVINGPAAESEHATSGEPADRQLPASWPAPAALPHGFATFEAVVGRKQNWTASNLVLIAAVGILIMIGVVIWAAVASPTERAANHPAANTEPKKDVAPATNPTTQPSSSQLPGSQATLKIEPTVSAQRQGGTFALNIVLAHGQDVASVPMEINYDPLVLRFVRFSNGEFFTKGGREAIVLHRDDPTTGVLKVNAQVPPGAAGISGDGAVCHLVFTAVEKGSGKISVAASARDSQNKPVHVLGSQVVVTVN